MTSLRFWVGPTRAIVAGGIAAFVAFVLALLLVGPFLLWLAWNVLDLAHAVGLTKLGFWGIVLAALFLGLDWFGKMVIVAIVFIVDPGWLNGRAQVRWPEPTFRNFVAIALVMLLAVRPLRAWRPRHRDSRPRRRLR